MTVRKPIHTIPYSAILSTLIQVYQFINAAAQANLLRMFQRMQSVSAVYPVLQCFTSLCRKSQINTRLVNGYRIQRSHDSNIMNIRFCGISVTVAVNRNIVQDTDINNAFPIAPL